MGIKGDKNTMDAQLAATALSAKLDSISGITTKKMFGGHGIFHDGRMFGMVDSKANIFFKTNEITRADFEALSAEKHSKMPYYNLPDAIMQDHDNLLIWAQKAINASKI